MDTSLITTIAQLAQFLEEKGQVEPHIVKEIIKNNRWKNELNAKDGRICSSRAERLYFDELGHFVVERKTHGGSRQGAGRPRKNAERMTFYASPAVCEIIKDKKNRSEYICECILKAQIL